MIKERLTVKGVPAFAKASVFALVSFAETRRRGKQGSGLYQRLK
jgi:hypothetical protein